MPSSITHNCVRIIQLCLSISLTTTAAILLYYRTKAHTNFTNEPLASCIAGAVAFIYALWAILNHRRHPDKHQWVYLHGLGCFVVCGLLIAGATLAIIFGIQGVSCQKLEQAHDYVEPGSSSVLQQQGANFTVRVSRPEFHDDQTYAPGQICENYYADMDKACAVLGIVAALFWLADFCLIFGFCRSKGRCGPHREYRRRGQVSPDDDDDIEGDNRDSAYGGSRDREFDPQDDYHDTLDSRRRNLERIEHNTREDPMRHVQGPIPMSMQTNYFSGNDSSDMKSVDQNNNPIKVVTAAPGSDQQLTLHHDCQTPPSASLNPPPRAQWRLIPTPESPTLPPMTTSSSQSTLQLDSCSQEESTKPAPVRLPSDISDSLTPKPAQPPPVHIQSAPSQTETKPYFNRQLSGPAAASEPVAVAGPTPLEPTSEDAAAPPTSSSPRYTEFPPGPACYAFDSCNHEYRPSYVNQAARNAKHQQAHKTLSAGVSKEKSLPSTPRGGTPPSVSTQVLVAGLGLEVIARSDTQIASEEKEAMELAKQQQQQKSMMASSVVAAGGGGGQKVSSPGKVEQPRKILPHNNHSHRPHGASSSHFPSAPASPVSSTASIRSFMSAKGQDPNSSPSSVNGSQTRPTMKQALMAKKPSLTKRKSKLSVVTQKAPDSGSERGGGGVQEAEPNKARSMSSSPSSPYIGDF
ncbi:hypothetical protein BGZ74_010826 [Mortierella antarctica]|nr:hypothetical protein BGZ74_010826 [Mortierella antarctica]